MDPDDIESWWALVHPPEPPTPGEVLQAALPSGYNIRPPILLTAVGSAKDFRDAVGHVSARHKLVLEGPVDEYLRNLLRLLVSEQGPKPRPHPVSLVLRAMRRLAREKDILYNWVRRSSQLPVNFKALLDSVVHVDPDEETRLHDIARKWFEGQELTAEETYDLFNSDRWAPQLPAVAATERVDRAWGLLLLAYASIPHLPMLLIVCSLHEVRHAPATLLFGWDGQDPQRVSSELLGILRETELVLRPEHRDAEKRIHPEGRSSSSLR